MCKGGPNIVFDGLRCREKSGAVSSHPLVAGGGGGFVPFVGFAVLFLCGSGHPCDSGLAVSCILRGRIRDFGLAGGEDQSDSAQPPDEKEKSGLGGCRGCGECVDRFDGAGSRIFGPPCVLVFAGLAVADHRSDRVLPCPYRKPDRASAVQCTGRTGYRVVTHIRAVPIGLISLYRITALRLNATGESTTARRSSRDTIGGRIAISESTAGQYTGEGQANQR